MKYVIDTDPGHDDVMAIILAVKAGLDVVALTTVAGNSTIENTTRNARYALDLLNRNDIPVYSGSEKPLDRELIESPFHGRGGLDDLASSYSDDLTNNAVEQLLSIIEQNEKTSLIALGPLTNVAKAILSKPELVSKLEEIVIMGGAIRVPGNKNRVAEFNIFIDPEAADIVFRFPVIKTIIPLDACNNVKLYLKDFEKIKGKLKKPLLQIAGPYITHLDEDEGVKAALMYDPLTVYYIINPGACILQQFDILVETRGGLTRGMTVADLRNKPEKTNMINVVASINPYKFRKDFIKYLSSA
ncbi:MAG: nucleoside hydrolase [archaeon]